MSLQLSQKRPTVELEIDDISKNIYNYLVSRSRCVAVIALASLYRPSSNRLSADGGRNSLCRLHGRQT